MPYRVSALAYALATMAAILGAALILQFRHGSDASAILHTPPRRSPIPGTPFATPLSNDLQTIQNGALFYATRKYITPPPTMPPSARAQLSSYLLMGTMLVPQRPPVAFLRRGPSGLTMTLSPGDHLDGWTVMTVQAGSATFGYGADRVTLTTPLPYGITPAAENAGITRTLSPRR